MAVLERTSTTTVRPAHVQPDHPHRTRRGQQSAPILLLGTLVALCVGYGIGSLAQFDNDWRSTPPALVASTEGAAQVGVPLAQALADLLSGTSSPVSAVSCPAGARVAGSFQQVCSARGVVGMVSIVASGSGSTVRVDVYAMT